MLSPHPLSIHSVHCSSLYFSMRHPPGVKAATPSSWLWSCNISHDKGPHEEGQSALTPWLCFTEREVNFQCAPTFLSTAGLLLEEEKGRILPSAVIGTAPSTEQWSFLTPPPVQGSFPTPTSSTEISPEHSPPSQYKREVMCVSLLSLCIPLASDRHLL